MVSATSLAVAIAAFPLLVCTLSGQTAAPAGADVIRVEATEVSLEVTLSGSSDRIQRDWQPSDFSVWEDGRQQKVNSVIRTSSDPASPLTHVVFYFDFSTLLPADAAASRRVADGLIDSIAGPGRYMAAMSLDATGPHVLRDFTNAKNAVRNAVVGAQAPVGRPGGLAGASNLAQSIDDLCKAMAGTPERKMLLLFSGGYGDPTGSLAGVFHAPIETCNRADVAIYVIAGDGVLSGGPHRYQPQGSCVGPACGSPIAVTTSSVDIQAADTAAIAQSLGDNTGGGSLRFTSSLDAALAALVRLHDESCRVFYTPPPAKEGACHKVRVAVNVRGVIAKSTGEYCTPAQPAVLAERIDRAAKAGVIPATIQLPWFYLGKDRAIVHLYASLTLTGIAFNHDAAGFHASLDLVGTAIDHDGKPVVRFADTRALDFPGQQELDLFLKAPYRYERDFVITPGTYAVELRAGTGSLAAADLKTDLIVRPYDAVAPGIGGIVFSTESHPAGSGDATPELEGRGPLSAAGRTFVPSPTNRFSPSDTIFFYTQVYDPALAAGASPASLLMGYQVVDRQSGAVKLDTGLIGVSGYVHAGEPVVSFATRLPAGFAPGAYRLIVQAAVPSTGQETSATADFDLER